MQNKPFYATLLPAVTCRMFFTVPAQGRAIVAGVLPFEHLEFIHSRRLDAMLEPVPAGGIQALKKLVVLVKKIRAAHRGIQAR